jgi:hypothetical protein
MVVFNCCEALYADFKLGLSSESDFLWISKHWVYNVMNCTWAAQLTINRTKLKL